MTEYNGWANYPTWDVHLWLTNEEALYDQALDLVASQRAILPEAEMAGLERVRTADYLKAWVVDELAPDLGASFAADLLGWALDSVDWFEIADSFIEAAAEVSA